MPPDGATVFGLLVDIHLASACFWACYGVYDGDDGDVGVTCSYIYTLLVSLGPLLGFLQNTNVGLAFSIYTWTFRRKSNNQ